jgi:putative membrane protein
MKPYLSAVAVSAFAVVSAQAASSDQTFVTKAGQAGAAEVALGSLATSRGSAAGVKSFGQHMVDDHTKAGEGLKAAASGSGLNVPTEPSSAQQSTAAALAELDGAAFDKKFAAIMVKDHEEAVSLFDEEAKTGKDPELKAFAAKTLPTLKDHLKMAKALH